MSAAEKLPAGTMILVSSDLIQLLVDKVDMVNSEVRKLREQMKSQDLTLQEAARYLGYSISHFRVLVKEHDIPHRGGRNKKFLIQDLDKWRIKNISPHSSNR